MNSFEYCYDEKITYKVEKAYIFDLPNGNNAIRFVLRIFCGGFPMVPIISQAGEEVPFSCTTVTSLDSMVMEMIRTDGFDFILTMKTNTMLTPTDELLTEIIPIDEVFGIIKTKVTNNVVYDVLEVSLGYIDVLREKYVSLADSTYYTHPVWNVIIDMGATTLTATIDSRTGELYLRSDRK